MKKVVFLLVAITIFMLCASVGYELATRTAAFLDKDQGGAIAEGTGSMNFGTPNTGGGSGVNLSGIDKCLLSIQVDRLDVQRPQLVSAWATKLYFDDQSNKIDFLPVYSSSMTSEKSRAVAKNFALDERGTPDTPFWRALAAIDVTCKDYIMIDEFGVVKVLNWINGRMDMDVQLKQNAGNPGAIRAMLEEACDKITGSASRELPPFHWTDLAPGHIRTNLTMDTALLYWDKTVNAPSPNTCSVSK